MTFEVGLDLFPLLAATLAAVTCGLLGNFLVLRRMSLMADAISHGVLPGLVLAFLLTASRGPLPMLGGAVIAGIATVVLVEVVRRFGGVEPGAAMGVVFTVLFALGVLLIEQAAARHIDLDAECVLHGHLETLVWYDAPGSWREALSTATLAAVPRQVTMLAVTALVAFAFTVLLFKELRIAAFDPALATALGFNATALHCLFMVLVAVATVASFEAVGSILVIAMLVCPAATARLLADRLMSQLTVSVAIALATGVGGYVAATAVPALWGGDSVNAAGAMTVVAGALLAAAIVASPRHGVLAKAIRRRRVAKGVAVDDLLAALHRAGEAGVGFVSIESVRPLFAGRSLRAAVADAARAGFLDASGERLALTERGRSAAAEIVRRHRLWEHYLVKEVALAPDHVHATAERLEHISAAPASGPQCDPHGRPIPDRE